MGDAALLSQSPNPRPKITTAPDAMSSYEHLAREYNAMVDEIEKLSAVLVSVGVDPHAALAWEPNPNGCAPHPAVVDVLRYFDYGHLPAHLQAFSRPLHHLAHALVGQLSGPQLTIGLHKLLEAKDAFVRAALPLLPE